MIFHSLMCLLGAGVNLADNSVELALGPRAARKGEDHPLLAQAKERHRREEIERKSRDELARIELEMERNQ